MEDTVELRLRPKTWDDYVGQERVKSQLRLMLDAAKNRKEPCDHLLFHGQAGLGKTTLAHIVAREMGAALKITTGPALEKTGDAAAILTNLEPFDILFIDEIHRLPKQIEEVLYPALESRKLNLVVGKGPAARTLAIDLPPFTFIGATTRASLLSAPLRSRFGGILHLNYYSETDMEVIIKRSARILGTDISGGAVGKLAEASRFTPRVANRLLKRCRDWVEVNELGAIDDEVVSATLELMEVDNLGLEAADRRIIRTIIDRFRGGPVGIKSLAAAVNEEIGTIEEVYEPFLLTIGLIERTPSGRRATRKAYQHLGYRTPSQVF